MTAYRKDIDGLRAVAVLAVVAFHAAPGLMPGGFIGVDVFFVISGFLISSIILEDCRTGTFSLARFYERRARRILPALFAVMAVTAAAGLVILFPPDLKDFGQALAAASVSLSNVLFWREAGYFSLESFHKPLLHTWSLGVEEQFYIAFPLLMLLVYKLAQQKNLMAIFSAVFVVSLLASGLLTRTYPEFAFYLPFTRAWELALGAILSLRVIPPLKNAGVNDRLSMLGAGLILGAAIAFTPETVFPGLAALVPCLGAALVIYTGLEKPAQAAQILCWRPLVFTGLISYSLYLWHWPLLAYHRYVSGAEPSALAALLLVAASFALAVLSWKYIEQPFRGSRGILRRGQIFALAAAGIALCVLAGGALHVTQGLPGRFEAVVNTAIAARGQNNPRHGACLLEGRMANLPPAAPCVFGADGGDDYSVVLWGDSQADHWVPGFEARAQAEGWRGRQITKAGCAPLKDALRVEKKAGARDDCRAFNAQVLEFIAQEPGVQTVILSARWALYAHDAGSTDADVFLIDDLSNVLSSENSQRVLRTRLQQTVAALRDAGKRVVIIGVTPEPGYNVPDCLARGAAFGQAACKVITRGDAARRAEFVDDVLRALGAQPGVDVFFPADEMCDAAICPVEREGVPVYFDGTHITAATARSLAPLAGRLP